MQLGFKMKSLSFSLLFSWLVLWLIPALALSADVDVYLGKARDYVSQQEYKSAVIELKNALQQEPRHAEARLLLGKAYVELGDGASAEKELRKALEFGLKAEKGMPLLGRAYLMQGKSQEALSEVRLADNAPVEARARVMVVHGNALLLQKSFEDAADAYEAALILVSGFPTALLGKARLAVNANDNTLAEKYVDQVLAANAEDVDALIVKGELLRRQAKHAEALAVFSQVSQLQPQNLLASLGKAMAEVALQQFDSAAKDLELILKLAPQHPIANYFQAVVYFQAGEPGKAKDALNKVLKVVPDHIQSLLLLGMASYQLGEFEQAEYHLSRFIAAAPDHVQGRKVLASVYLKLKQPQQVIETLDVLSHDSSDAQLLALLGTAYLHIGDNEKGTENLQKAAELAPDMASIRAQLALGRLVAGENEAAVSNLEMAIDLDQGLAMADMLLVYSHIRTKQFDKAIAAAQALVKKQPDSPVALNILGVSYANAGKSAEAKRQFEKALEIDFKFAAAYMGLAQLAIEDGKSEQAKNYYQQLLKVDASHLGAMLALARVADAAGDRDTALNWIKKAGKANPKSLEPMLLLANAYLVQGEPMKALTVAREAADVHPQHPLAKVILGKAQLANEGFSNAISTFQGLVNLRPESIQALMLLAEAQIKASKFERGVETLTSVLTLNKDSVPAKIMLARIHIQSKQYGEAKQLADQIITKSPEVYVGYELLGDQYLAQNKKQLAEESYAKAFSKEMKVSNVVKLYRTRSQLGLDNALVPLEQWLKANPEDVSVRLMLAMGYQRADKFKSGIEHYLIVLKYQHENVAALNNVAWLYQQENDKRALEYAKKVNALAPGNPAVMDTVGWIYVESGKVNEGLILLQEARAKAPHIPEISYHLAIALEKAGRTEEAGKELNRLLRDFKAFEGRGEAEALLQRL